MTKKLLLAILLTCAVAFGKNPLLAQVRNVTYDAQKNTFDNDYNLPSEERFTISGLIDTSIQLVELDIYQGKKKNGEPKIYYSTQWKRYETDKSNQFFLSVKSPLRQNSKYDFDFRYYKRLQPDEKAYTQASISTSIQNYLVSISRSTAKGFELDIKPEVIRTELDRIVHEGLKEYRSVNENIFPGFSDIILRQLNDMSEMTGRRAKSIQKEDGGLEEEYVNKLAEIIRQADLEVEQYLNNDLLIQTDKRTVQDHPTERQKNIIALNAGYGGVWFSGNLNHFDYDHAPYVGISFPLGKKGFSNKFWSNSAISTGVFVTNFKDKDGNKIKGPIIQVPFYLAYGYRFFRFVRINAGAVLLEKKSDNGNFLNTDKIMVRPFVGLSLELNFWADFAK